METILTKNKWIRNQHGYSVLEVITVILFIGIALPTLVMFFSQAISNGAEAEVQTKALMLCEQKMEEVLTDKLSPSRGYSWMTTPNRYVSENISGGYTRTVAVATTGKSFNGVAYAEITVTVSHSLITPIQLVSWATMY
ncbi:hypothetical protein K1X84_06645 [bacterium]|nr:hypothetical protein [bacterium]